MGFLAGWPLRGLQGRPGRLTDGLLILPGGGVVGLCCGFEGGGMGFGY